MSAPASPTYTSFDGVRRIATGSLHANALAVRHARDADPRAAVLTFDDATGRMVDVNTHGTLAQVAARYPAPAPPTQGDGAGPDTPRGRGRPKLGVVPREVTLLPRHWEWLATQPGGASVALRKLVEAARRTHADADRERQGQERAYHFISALAGDLPGFEEATRALFANDGEAFAAHAATWPADVRDHAMHLAWGIVT